MSPDAPDVQVCRQVMSSHTCIRLSVERKYTHYIPMATLNVERQENKLFAEEWAPLEGHTPKKVALQYLSLTKHRLKTEKAISCLAMVAGITPEAAAKLGNSPSQSDYQEIQIMATAKPTTATKPAVKKPVAAAAPATNKKVAPPAPAAKAAKPSANVPTTPKAAAEGKGKATPAAAPAPKKDKAPAGGRAAAPDTTKYVVGDDSSVKRGDSRLFIDTAKTLKTFTRDELVNRAVKDHGFEAERMVRYFYYFTGKGVLVTAPGKA